MKQYLDFMRHVSSMAPKVRPHRHRHALGVRLPDALRPERGLSVVTTKKLHLKSIIHELLWFLQGDQHPVPEGQRRHHLGRMGRRQRRTRPGLRLPVARWPTPDGRHIDQISEVVQQIRSNPIRAG
jgi:thymidylate synthase